MTNALRFNLCFTAVSEAMIELSLYLFLRLKLPVKIMAEEEPRGTIISRQRSLLTFDPGIQVSNFTYFCSYFVGLGRMGKIEGKKEDIFVAVR
ncbi:hypothetical protein SUGI_0197770 [Cryptomeria japonica]|nr:hypothetical protein SUGI_0197770 [Cryptomeria japonica]